MWSIGVDESGRGAVVGPLVIGCLAIPSDDIILLKEKGITDSKLIRKEKRKEIRNWLIKQSKIRNWRYVLISCPPAEIDLSMQLSNLNALECERFGEAVGKVCNSKTMHSGTIYLDACDTDAERFGTNVAKYIPKWPWDNWDIDSKHGADLEQIVVGAASILAKVERDEQVNILSKSLNIDIGSGYPSDSKTKSAIVKLIKNKTPHECLRWRWATTNQLMNEMYNINAPMRSESDVPLERRPSQRTLF